MTPSTFSLQHHYLFFSACNVQTLSIFSQSLIYLFCPPCTSSLAQRETKRTPCPLTWCLKSERTSGVMTPLQTSQEMTALLPTDIIPHIPSSPQTHPLPSKTRVSKPANALFPSHLKYMTHKSPGEYLFLLASVWNTLICLP